MRLLASGSPVRQRVMQPLDRIRQVGSKGNRPGRRFVTSAMPSELRSAPRSLDHAWRDVRLACRTLAATPLATLVAVASLALGIGANTAIFSLLNSLLLRTLPVNDPSRLVLLSDA